MRTTLKEKTRLDKEHLLQLDPKKKIIYLGVPYTHKDPAVMETRFKQATKITALLIEKGYIVFSPVPYSVPYEKMGVEPPEGWYKYLLYHLRNSDILYIVMFPGWQASEGLKLEQNYARRHGIPIVRVDPSDIEV